MGATVHNVHNVHSGCNANSCGHGVHCEQCGQKFDPARMLTGAARRVKPTWTRDVSRGQYSTVYSSFFGLAVVFASPVFFLGFRVFFFAGAGGSGFMSRLSVSEGLNATVLRAGVVTYSPLLGM